MIHVMKWVLQLLLLVSASLSVSAAFIEGTVYDLGLNEVQDAIVRINTTPAQRMVAKDATYSFQVPPGSYKIEAAKNDLTVSEVVSTGDQGSYVLDLIMIPAFDSIMADEELEAPEVEPLVQDEPKPLIEWLGWITALLLLAFVVYKFSKSQNEIKKVSVNDDLEKIMHFLEKQGGRATQKEIRSIFPYSEAKVSMMVSELEGKGLVERLKKGRSNLVVKK